MNNLADIVNAPWAIIPDRLVEIRNIYDSHLNGEKIDIEKVETRLGFPLKNERIELQVVENTAVISMHGVIAKKANMFMEISGGVSTEIVGQEFTEAMSRPEIETIILDIDSPGGSVDGIDALAEKIYSARGTKNIIAFANGTMASAAYYIGAAADKIYILDEMTEVGSIGVVMTISEQLNKNQVVHEIYAGKYKRIVSANKPLTEEGREYLQAKVDYAYSIFVGKVAKFRGVTEKIVLSQMSDGDIFTGKQAIQRGLADEILTLDAIIKSSTRSELGKFNKKKVSNMSKAETVIVMTTALLMSEHPDIYEQIKKEGVDSIDAMALKKEGGNAERTRIHAVMDQSMHGHETLISKLAFDGATTGPEAAVQVLAAEKKVKIAVLDNHRKDAEITQEHSEPEMNKSEGEKSENKMTLKERWDSNPDMHDEFPSFEAFEALMQNEPELLGK